MNKKRVDKGIEDSEVKEELEKVEKPKKTTSRKKKEKKTKSKENKKEKKAVKKEKKKLKKEEKLEKKKTRKKKNKKRKLKKSNILVMIICIFFLIASVVAILYGIGALTFKLKDPGPNYYDLSEKVKVGDYVDYDAGHWEEEKEVPNRGSQFTLGGYKVSTSRNDGVNCGHNEVGNSGWRVFSVEDDVVTLIQAGISMCYYHGYGANTNEQSVNILNNLDESKKFDYFKDEKYSESVRMLSKEDIDKFNGGDSSYYRISDDLISVGNPYWLATKNGTHYMWYVTEGGTVAVDHVGVYGVRVLVTLKKNTKTIGVDKEGNWILTAETKKDE